MRIAVVSDLHLGAEDCTLDPASDDFRKRFGQFCEAVGQNNDYLILLGDVLDLSARHYAAAYRAAAMFFAKVAAANLAHKLIYVPGNHDYEIWHTVEYQVNIINRLAQGKEVEPFRFAVPGIFDMRTNSPIKDFQLADVSRHEPDLSGATYGGLFFDRIAGQPGANGPELRFYFAYPNVYIIDDEQTILLTHGHYFESWYSITAMVATTVDKTNVLGLQRVGDPNMKEYSAMNFPLNQLACTGVGQAGPFSHLVAAVQSDVQRRDLKRLRNYLFRIPEALDRSFGLPSLARWPMAAAGWTLTSLFSGVNDARWDERFLDRAHTRGRAHRYYRACLRELEDLAENRHVTLAGNIPAPQTVIFGHTHEPIPIGAKHAPTLQLANHRVKFYNLGGWINQPEGGFGGATVAHYDTRSGLTSTSVA